MISGRASERGVFETAHAKISALNPVTAHAKPVAPPRTANSDALRAASRWFAEHVTLFGEPYTLDDDQVRAVIDDHKNTLVTARAGSGKTRVIVAKIAYLVARKNLALDEVAVFMFNRAAAAEVNERIGEVKIDGISLANFRGRSDAAVKVASTFHKFALNIVKSSGARPKILSEFEHARHIRRAFDSALRPHKFTPTERRELLKIASGFIARAGQKYPGLDELASLRRDIEASLRKTRDPKIRLYYTLSYRTYANYLAALQPPETDFNLLMSRAAEILNSELADCATVRKLKYLLIDEYQDFSYLFLALTNSIRCLAPSARLFAVGDDWQAINRFAGSDVDYFLNFARHFPEDCVNIPLATNYRSSRKIVEYANRYMLTNYDSEALPARAFSRKSGKITFRNPSKLPFDSTDLSEDRLGDGRFSVALARASLKTQPSPAVLRLAADLHENSARLLKQIYKIVKRHRSENIMLLHRHNFTTSDKITLETLMSALSDLLASENIMSPENFARRIRCMTMHKSKGLESEIVILLEVNHKVVASAHPHAAIFDIFGDSRATEIADQQRLLYVAITRAKNHLYILSNDKNPPI